MKVGIFKKVALFAGAAVALAAVSGAVGVGAFYVVNSIKENNMTNYVEKNISSQDQVKKLLDASKADDRFLMKQNKRITNNNEEPIYVSFADNFYVEENKNYLDVSIDVMDTFFDIIHDINPKYKYKILKDSELTENKYKDKSVIKFYLEPIKGQGSKETYAHVRKMGLWNLLTINSDKSQPDIYWNNYDKQGLTKVLVHEFDHIFNIEDIYDFDDPHVDTAVDVKFLNGLSPIALPTPNDYACFLSMYTPSMSNEELTNFVNYEMPQKIESYKQKYYDAASTWVEYDRNDLYSFPENFTEETFVVDWNKEACGYLNVAVEEDKYSAILYDVNKQFVSSCEGNVYNSNKFIFLEDMYFPNGLYFEEGGHGFDKCAHYQTMGISYYTAGKYSPYDSGNRIVGINGQNLYESLEAFLSYQKSHSTQSSIENDELSL